ncbi:MAG: hypothetical protein R8M46_02470 [Ghiorsea sp.]
MALFSLQNKLHIWLTCLGLGVLMLMPLSQPLASEFKALSKAEQARIADLIFRNECNRKVECLVSWNDGEKFASLGIGHFIWFPKGSKALFQESFPDLLRWFQAHGVKKPRLLAGLLQPQKASPWQSKAEFLKPENQNNIQLLRNFLAETKNEQAGFIMFRLSKALLSMLDAATSIQEQIRIQQQFERVSASPNGWYVLADYVNFKGEGIKESERYQGKGWGLAQVLMRMKGDEVGKQAIQSFTHAASYILERRVKLSPPERNEQRWLKGWKKRLNTYVVID